MDRINNRDNKDLSKVENLYLTGVLDELKMCFNYSGQVSMGDTIKSYCYLKLWIDSLMTRKFLFLYFM